MGQAAGDHQDGSGQPSVWNVSPEYPVQCFATVEWQQLAHQVSEGFPSYLIRSSDLMVVMKASTRHRNKPRIQGLSVTTCARTMEQIFLGHLSYGHLGAFRCRRAHDKQNSKFHIPKRDKCYSKYSPKRKRCNRRGVANR